MRFERPSGWMVVAVLAVLGWASPPALAAPTAVVFDVGHSDCTAPGAHTFDFYVNESRLEAIPLEGSPLDPR